MTSELPNETKQITDQSQLQQVLENKANIQWKQIYIQDVKISNSELKQIIEKLAISELQLQNVQTDSVVEINQSEIKRLIIGSCNAATQIILNCENLTDLSVIGNEELRSFWSQHKHLALDTLEIELNPQLTAVENISTELLFCQENEQIELSKVQDLLVNQQLLKTLIYSQYSEQNEIKSTVDFLDLIRFSAIESLKLSSVTLKEFEGLQYLYKLQKLEVSNCQITIEDGDVPTQELNCVLRQVVFRKLQTQNLDFLTNPVFSQLQQLQLDFSDRIINTAFRPQSAQRSGQRNQNTNNSLENVFFALLCVTSSIRKVVLQVNENEAVNVARQVALLIRNAPLNPTLVVNGQEIPLFPVNQTANKQQGSFQPTPTPQSAKKQVRDSQQQNQIEKKESIYPWTAEEDAAPRTFDDVQNELWEQIKKVKNSISLVSLFRRSLWGMKLPSAAKKEQQIASANEHAATQEADALRIENAQLRAHIDQLMRAQGAAAFAATFQNSQSSVQNNVQDLQSSKLSNSGLQSSQALQNLDKSGADIGPRPLSGVRFRRNALAPMEFSKK